MKKIFLILISVVLLTGCYTTLYPPANMDMSVSDEIPDSARQVIINNYYESTEYYQVPSYHRYSLLWGSYYWDPFYYDYSYYRWRPYYWYGNYYYYNPYSNYWYYYDPYYPWHSGSWTGGSSGGNGDKSRIHKPGYNVLMSSTSESAPFVSVGTNNNSGGISKPGKKIGIDLNSDVTNNNGYYSNPNIQSLGKQPATGTTSDGNLKKSGSTYKAPSNKKPASTVYKPQKQRSSSSSSSSAKSSKSANTKSSSSKNSRNESSSSSSKKSK